MQIIFENEDEGKYGRRTSVVGIVICAGEISGYMERECDRGDRSEGSRI